MHLVTRDEAHNKPNDRDAEKEKEMWGGGGVGMGRVRRWQ